MDRIPDPAKSDDMSEQELLQKKALKLYHMAWSGVTKYMRQICQVKCKPIEFPNLGIFCPVRQIEGTDEDGVPMKLTNQALANFAGEDYNVKFFVSKVFLDQCGGAVNIERSEDGLIDSYDPSIGEH